VRTAVTTAAGKPSRVGPVLAWTSVLLALTAGAAVVFALVEGDRSAPHPAGPTGEGILAEVDELKARITALERRLDEISARLEPAAREEVPRVDGTAATAAEEVAFVERHGVFVTKLAEEVYRQHQAKQQASEVRARAGRIAWKVRHDHSSALYDRLMPIVEEFGRDHYDVRTAFGFPEPGSHLWQQKQLETGAYLAKMQRALDQAFGPDEGSRIAKTLRKLEQEWDY
jgi:hypothetical protein